MLKKNVGGIDRLLRLVVGVVLVGIFVLAKLNVLDASGWMGSPWLLIGIIPLATGLMSSCPLYSVLGIRTCCKKD
ncbi:MAG: hypothetical protein CSA68_01075 [Rhodobacterales bacterium]|nr:MAG: hypothetical protein CSA68_01075 [Rhodobacterales bacterium]